MGKYYQDLDSPYFDYCLSRAPGLEGMLFRGPHLDPDRPYVACLGGAQTFGRFCERPYPQLLQEALGFQVANLGIGGAGPERFLSRRYFDPLNSASLVIVQVMSGRSASNSQFSNAFSGGHRGVRVKDGKRMRFEEFFRDLNNNEPVETVQKIVTETRESYVRCFIDLLLKIEPPTVLLWFSTRSPSQVVDGMGAFPQLVNRRMIEQIARHANCYLECVTARGLPQKLWRAEVAVDGTRVQDGVLYNRYYPSPEMHADAAALLIPECRKLLQQRQLNEGLHMNSDIPTGLSGAGRRVTVAPPASANPLLGVHIPKCAGTTLLRRVQSKLPEHQLHQSTSIKTAQIRGQLPFLSLWNYADLRFVFGHAVHEEIIKRFPVTPVLFTGLREPEARFRSSLGWTQRLQAAGHKSRPIEEIITTTKNPICWFLIRRFPTLAGGNGTPADRAMRALRAFSLCYFAENFESSADVITTYLGIDPARENHRVSPEPLPSIEFDKGILRYDFELYERAQEYFLHKEVSPSDLRPTRQVQAIHLQQEDTDALRRFLLHEQRMEYFNWSMLEEVIRQRTELLTETEIEIAYYKGLAQ